MNRYFLSAHSLLTDSWIVWTGIGLGALFSLIALAMGSSETLWVLGACLCLGIAYSARTCLMWEPAQIIPDMKRTYAATAVGLALLIWLVLVICILVVNGFSAERIALSLIAVSTGLWFGSGDRYWHIPFVLLAGSIWLLSQFPSQISSVYEAYSELSFGLRLLLTFVVLVCGFATIVRYWYFVAYRPTPPLTHAYLRKSLASVNGSHPDIAANIAADVTEEIEWEKDLTSGQRSGIAGRSRIVRLQALLYQPTQLTFAHGGFYAAIGIVSICFLVALYGNAVASVLILWLASMALICLPVSVFLFKVPDAFERMWVSGIAGGRAATIRGLLWMSMRRTVPVFLVLVAAILIQASTSFVIALANVMVLTLAFAFGGLIMCAGAKWYRYVARRTDPIVLGFLVFAATGAIIITVSSLDSGLQSDYLFRLFGIVPVCVAAIGLLLAVWTGGVYEAANKLGREKAFME